MIENSQGPLANLHRIACLMAVIAIHAGRRRGRYRQSQHNELTNVILFMRCFALLYINTGRTCRSRLLSPAVDVPKAAITANSSHSVYAIILRMMFIMSCLKPVRNLWRQLLAAVKLVIFPSFLLLIVAGTFPASAPCLAHDIADAKAGTLLRYVGSSTIAHFIRDADSAYGRARFSVESASESAGGERAIIEGRADIAGVARIPGPAILAKGVTSTLIAWDAIAVVVHRDNPIRNVTRRQLRDIFTGVIVNWRQLGGANLPIRPYIVNNESATHKVFRSAVLKEQSYSACQVVSPDSAMPAAVAADPGGIGQISFSFLRSHSGIRRLAVDGQEANLNNPDYPITRPLYLLWWPGRSDVAAFASWTQQSKAQTMLGRRFIASLQESPPAQRNGVLVVVTDTSPVEDGGVFYYPHLPYRIFSNSGELIRSVPNHRGDNDEHPSRVSLPPGNYRIEAETANAARKVRLLVTIQANQTTRANATGRNQENTSRGKGGNSPAAAETPAVQDKSLPGAFAALKPYGDLRIRAEADQRIKGDRLRGRYRIRAGMSADLGAGIKVDLRLVSTANPDDPNSTHVNLDNGFNQIEIVIDRAFFAWNPPDLDELTLWLGKFANPFVSSSVYSEVVWDGDIQPDGLALALKLKDVAGCESIRFTNGSYLIAQFSEGSKAPWLNASQIAASISLPGRLSLTLAGGLYAFNNIKGEDVSATVFDGNAGNSTYTVVSEREGETVTSEHYRTNFHISDNFLVLRVGSLPLPLNIKGEYIHNFGADSNNSGFATGFSYGKLETTGDWKAYYQYQAIQQDALFSAFAQDDALRQTDFTGHVFGIAYALHKNVSLHAWTLIDQAMNGEPLRQQRLRLDLNVKI